MHDFYDDVASEKGNDAKSFKAGIWRSYHWRTAQENLTAALKRITKYCDQHRFRILATFPLTRAQAYEHSQGEYTVWPSAPAATGFSAIAGMTAQLRMLEAQAKDTRAAIAVLAVR